MDERRSFVPYKGLTPYTEDDADFFFGRDREREVIISNLMATRLTVLYGASGVGKSSVLRAGVAHALEGLSTRSRMQRGAPEFAVVVFSDWRDEPVSRLAHEARAAVERALSRTIPGESDGVGLSRALETWTDSLRGDLFIVLDQFEEFFLYHNGSGQPFLHEFARAVAMPDLRANFLISIREDSLAKLDGLKGSIPRPLENFLRIDHLDRTAAQRAIEGPIEQYNRTFGTAGPIRVDPALVQAVLDQVETGRVTLDHVKEERGRGGSDEPGRARRIETPYLQLVMERIWAEEMRSGSPELRAGTLDALGGAERIVRTHLDQAMAVLPSSQRDVAAKLFRYLVTPSGTKIAYPVNDLADLAEVEPKEAGAVLERLSEGDVRILRTVAPPPPEQQPVRYEVFHDVLALAVLDWRRRYLEARARAKAMRRWRLAGIAIAVLLALLSSSVVFAIHQNPSPTPEPTGVLAIDITRTNLGRVMIGRSGPRRTVVTLGNDGTAPLSVTDVTRIGANPNDFAIDASACLDKRVRPDQSCNITGVFTPQATGDRSAILQIVHNGAGSPAQVPLSGTGVDPALEIGVGEVNFGSVPLGSSKTLDVELSSTGVTPLTIFGVVMEGGDLDDFVVDASACAVGPLQQGDSCAIVVVFEPSSPGQRGATLAIRHNAPGSPAHLPLRGSGTDARLSVVPAALGFDFPKQDVVTLESIGGTAVTISGIRVLGVDAGAFSAGQDCVGTAMATSQSCSVTVSFDPAIEGAFTASMQIEYNGPDSPALVALTGVHATVE